MSAKIDWDDVWAKYAECDSDRPPASRGIVNFSRCRIEELVCEQLGIHRFTDREQRFCQVIDSLRLIGPEAQEWLTDKGQALHLKWVQQEKVRL